MEFVVPDFSALEANNKSKIYVVESVKFPIQPSHDIFGTSKISSTI